MGEKLLHMNDPIIYTYNIYGSIFSMISHDKNIWPWVYNNFIQLRYVQDWKSYFFDNHHMLFDSCPWLDHYIIPKSIIISKWNSSLKDFIIDAINNNSYIYCYVDRYYISKSSQYLKQNQAHEIFIYGYNTEENKVYIADNLLNGKYIKTDCSFEEIEKGYFNIEYPIEFFYNVHLFNKTPGNDLCFNIDQVAVTLKNYLKSTKSIDMSFKEKSIFGMNSVYHLVNTLDECSQDSDSYLDLRAFHLLWEHKVLMELRLKYMMDNSYLNDGGKIIDGYSTLKQKYLIIRSYALKYNISHNRNIISLISEYLKKELIYEEELICELLTKITFGDDCTIRDA